ncbi:MAG TPA: SdpI family protein [Caulobacteraceae bacterium]|nr:SdpI family protein [Caulobacteraceae bacterium]
MTRFNILAAGLIGGTAFVAVWAYAVLPPDARIAVHFAASGQANGFMAKGPGLALLPAIGAAVILTLICAPGLFYNDEGLAASADTLGVVTAGVAAIFLVSEGAIVCRAFDPGFDVIRWLFVAIGVLLVVSGNLLGKVRRNGLIGIRTPWTLRDARVWDKTHRFTGRLMVLGGLVLTIVPLASGDHSLMIEALVVCAAGPALAGVVFSAVISRPAARV